MKYLEYSPRRVVNLTQYTCNDADYRICRAFGMCGISGRSQQIWEDFRKECLKICRRLVEEGYARAFKDPDTGVTSFHPTESGQKIIDDFDRQIQQELDMFRHMSQEKN